jgi:hypothetical protein
MTVNVPLPSFDMIIAFITGMFIGGVIFVVAFRAWWTQIWR